MKRLTQKILLSFFAYLVLHSILLISLYISYEITGIFVNMDILLIIILCAYIHVFYNIYFKI